MDFSSSLLLLLLLLVFCCSSRSMTPITETHHRHLSSARFFAVSYPSHMSLISCSLFLPLVRFPVILPSRTSRNNTSCRRTCPSHLHFRWFIVLMIQRFSLTRFRTSELLTFAVQLIFSIFLHIHISKASILFISVITVRCQDFMWINVFNLSSHFCHAGRSTSVVPTLLVINWADNFFWVECSTGGGCCANYH